MLKALVVGQDKHNYEDSWNQQPIEYEVYEYDRYFVWLKIDGQLVKMARTNVLFV